MTEVERITDQMQRAFEGKAWCGTALREVLSDVTADEAAAKPLPRSLSIWEMVLHLAAWKGAIRQRVLGERVVVPADGDFPPVPDVSEETWRGSLELLERRHRELQETVAALPDSRLDEAVVEGMASVYVTRHGILQHDLYHASQMALLKKAQRQPSAVC
jgi:uncharacterized damage-inducible protein DinB